ncbi:MAG: CDP-alcohol phosphatidyltransferase family protein [Gammaproteobacteria bacterium]
MEHHLKSIQPSADERKPPPVKPRPARRRGAFLLPNLFTTASLFSGFYSIIAGMNGHFAVAGIAIYVSLVLDGLDGRVARLTDTATAFGAQFDSLSDMVAFGLAPALLVYTFCQRALEAYGPVWSKVGWLLVFFYAATAALRLARFNARAGTVGKRYFQGLPSPSAAALIAGLVWFSVSQGYSAEVYVIPALVVTVLAGLLMVSNLGYYSFKELRLDRRLAFPTVLLIPLLFILVTLSPSGVLFGGFLIYAVSAPLWWGVRQYRRYRRRR